MRLHINSEVNPWPYGHLELNKIVVKPCELSVFYFNSKKYKLFEEYKGELYGISVIYYDYDHPAIPGEGADPDKKYPSLLHEKYLWYSPDPADKSLPKSKRYIHQIKLLQFEEKRKYIKQFISRIEIDKEKPLGRRSKVYIHNTYDNKVYVYLLYSQNSKYERKTKHPELLEIQSENQ